MFHVNVACPSPALAPTASGAEGAPAGTAETGFDVVPPIAFTALTRKT